MNHAWEMLKTVAAILLSPIAEKNPVKVWSYRAPVVLSAERIIAMGAFAAWVHIAYTQPALLNGWPLSTFGVFVVLALPITRALSRAPVAATIDFAKTLVGRFGRGAAAQVMQGTSASNETPVLPEYQEQIDEIWEDYEPAGIPEMEPSKPAAEPSKSEPQPAKLEGITVVAESRKPDTTPAEARPKPDVKQPPRPIDQPWPNDPPWLRAAFAERGVIEVEGPGNHPRILEYFTKTSYKATADSVPWCSAGLCFVFEAVGIRSTRDARARSWVKWGDTLSGPRRGCVVVLSRGADPTSGHVTLCIAHDADYVWGYGANQNNRWSVQKYPRSRVLAGGYRWPTEATNDA